MRLLLILVLLLRLPPVGAQLPGPVLETVGAVRALTLEEAGRHYRVKLRGTITFYNREDGHAFLQDDTGGIFFRPGQPHQPGRLEFSPGERVEISGVTVKGRFSPSVAGEPLEDLRLPGAPVSAVRLGHGPLPEPLPATIDQLQGGEFHNQFVKVRATIREVSLHSYRGGQRIGLTISAPRAAEGTSMRAYVSRPEVAPEEWNNTLAELRGVAAAGGDDSAQLRDVRLLIPSPAQVAPQLAAMREAFAQDPRPLDALFRYEPPGVHRALPHLRVHGAVTLTRPGEGFYLGTHGKGLWVQTPQVPPPVQGDMLDVIGIPAREERRGYLQDAIFRHTRHGSVPLAQPATLEEILAGGLVSTRVTVEGELVDMLHQPGHERLFLKAAGRTFQAHIAEPKADSRWTVGSRLSITGICELAAPSPPGTPPPAFTLLVASSADVTVLSAPPWLTPARLLRLALALSAALALGLLWVFQLRRQVARQTAIIAEQSAQKALVEERQRIARELHDTLEQQLAGVHLHLDAVSDWITDAPVKVRSALGAARAMLAHSRTEAQQSVFELRSPALEQLGLVGAVRDSAAQFAERGAPPIHVTVTGEERRLPRLTEFHLLRIVQEAITNALKHAAATRIDITFEFTDTRVRALIRDDGRGFDPAVRTGDGKLHFGLLGMRERAAKIQGRLDVRTALGTGVMIVVEAPAPAATGSGMHDRQARAGSEKFSSSP